MQSRIGVCLACFIFLANLVLAQQPLAAAKKNGKWGYIGSSGTTMIVFEYDEAYPFNDGLALVRKGEKWSYILPDGGEAFPLTYNKFWDFSNGLASVSDGKMWGYIDPNGKEKILLKYVYAGDFSEGLAPVILPSDTLPNHAYTYSYIDKAGKVRCKSPSPVILQPELRIFPFQNGLAKIIKEVETNKLRYGYMDTTGKQTIGAIFEIATGFSQGRAVVGKRDMSGGFKGVKFGYIDLSGNVVLDYQYNAAHPYKEGLARVNKEGKWGFIDFKGALVCALKYIDAGDFSQNRALVCNLNYAYGFVNEKGKEIIGCVYESAKSFSYNLAAVKKGGLWGFVDSAGMPVIAPQFEDVKPFSR